MEEMQDLKKIGEEIAKLQTSEMAEDVAPIAFSGLPDAERLAKNPLLICPSSSL